VARSYFSRLVRGGENAPLRPARPVSNLWKTAQIDSAAAPARAESLAPSRRSTPQPSRAANFTQPLNPAEGERLPTQEAGAVKAVHSSSAGRGSQTSSEAFQLAPAPAPAFDGAARIRGARRDSAGQPGHGQPGLANQSREPELPAVEQRLAGLPSSVAAILQRRFTPAISPTASISSRTEPTTQPPGQSPPGRALEVKPDPTDPRLLNPAESNPQVVVPASAIADKRPMPVSRSAPPHNAADAVGATRPLPTPALAAEPPSAARHQPVQPLGLAPPTRLRDQSGGFRQSAPSEEPRAKGNTVQIGRIEVQVIPPPVSIFHSAPAQPRSRLARGYAVWPGW
jgi:hypothetical protein